MLLTTVEAADELRVSTRQLQRLVKAGALPVVEVGNQRRIARADLERYIAEHRQGASA